MLQLGRPKEQVESESARKIFLTPYLGQAWNDLTTKTLQEAAPDAEITADPAVAEGGPGSELDNLVEQGDSKVYVENKYSLPQDGSSLTRAYNQLTNGVNVLGENDSIILNVARAPTADELSEFLSGLPPEVIHNVQVVSTVTDLYTAVQTALGI